MSGTSSDDADYDGFTIKDLSQVRWTPRLESILEEMLIRNQFDFKNAAKEFERTLNKDEPRDSASMYKIDGKTLQLRWTDIEIRRHVIPKMMEKNKLDDLQQAAEDNEELPPLEEPLEEAKEFLHDVINKMRGRDNSPSSSDEENKSKNMNSTAQTSALDLEELD